MVVLVALVAGAGTRRAVASSLPGSDLYVLKLAFEDLTLGLTPAGSRAAAYTHLSETRTGELAALSEQPQPAPALLGETAEAALSRASLALDYLDRAPASDQAGLLSRLVTAAGRQQEVLKTVREKVPAESVAGLDHALEAARAQQAAAAARLQDQTHPASDEPAADEPTITPTSTLTSQATATAGPPGQTRVPPGQTQVPPGQTRIPPGRTAEPTRTHVPPGQTRVPPGQTRVPPGQTRVPPGQTRVPPGQTRVPPGQTRVPPGQTRVPPRPTKAPPGQKPVLEKSSPPGRSR
jgi:hypothetical protein